ncbi:MAG: DUF192 domain-containing protein [Erysipelotrichaceae bacterium]|nr:DUF192 domain-containing protein [Erysipelotrichaceae bacterium]
MKLRYQDREIELVECRSFFSRFRGFMMKKNIHYALLFCHCNSIHTFFMREAIDVVFCDENNIVLYYYKNLKPNRVVWPKRGATRVYELPIHYFDIEIDGKLEVE